MTKYILSCLFGLLLTSGIFSQDTIQVANNVELTERLHMIRQMLDRNERNAGIWWKTWLGIYGSATVVQGTVACLTPDKSTREDMILGAGTTMLGFAGQLIAPVKSGYVAKSEKQTNDISMEQQMEDLRQAEAMLKYQADRAKSGKNWQTHALSGAVNLSSGLITWIGFKRSVWAGLGNFAMNTIVTEIQIWSEPTKSMNDYEHYCNTYNLADTKPSKRPEFEWYAHVQPNGIGLEVSF